MTGVEEEKKTQSLLSDFFFFIMSDYRVIVISLIRGGLVLGLGRMLSLVLDIKLCERYFHGELTIHKDKIPL